MPKKGEKKTPTTSTRNSNSPCVVVPIVEVDHEADAWMLHFQHMLRWPKYPNLNDTAAVDKEEFGDGSKFNMKTW